MTFDHTTIKRLLTLTLGAALIAALLLAFAGPSFAKKGGKGGGNGGGGDGDDPPPSNLPEYTIEFLGDDTTRIYGMNEFSDLVGESGTNLPFPHDEHAFIDIDGVGMLDLHVLADPGPDVVLRRAHAVNNSGQVAVMGWRDLDGDEEPDVYAVFRLTLDDGFGMPVVDELELSDPLGFNSNFMGINDDGDVIASVDGIGTLWSSDGDGDGMLDAVPLEFGVRFYSGGGITNRGLDGTVQITGDTNDLFDMWRWTGDLSGNGTLIDLGLNAGGNSRSFDINENGDIVGSIAYYEPGFRYTDDRGIEVVGQLVTRPRGGEFIRAHAWGINNVRETVGWAAKGRIAGRNENTRFLHHDDFGTVDVAPLISNWTNGVTPGGGGSFESYPLSINDTGIIAGNAAEGAFILTPNAP